MLIIFQNRNHGARDAETRTVERVNEFGFGAGRAPKANVAAPRLKIAHIRRARNFEPFANAGRPHFEVIRFRRAKAEVARAELFDAVRNFELQQNVLDVREHVLQFLFRLFGLAVFVHFHFVELKAALDAARVFARREIFFAKARRVRGVIQRQLFAVENFVHVQTRERNFRRRHEPRIALDIVIQIFTEFR